jgi:hypothetical protein
VARQIDQRRPNAMQIRAINDLPSTADHLSVA